MTPTELAADLRTRINPAYEHQLGTESYERRVCAEAIEGLVAESEMDYAMLTDNAVLINALRADRQAMFVELESLKAQVYAAAPRTIGNVGTACGEYVDCYPAPRGFIAQSGINGTVRTPVDCSGRPDAPHGVDVEASFRTGRTVCVCKSWAPGEAS